MENIKMDEHTINDIYSGVYKITFPNNKIYIGISNHIYRRILEHNTDFRNNLPIEYAIQKYGKIDNFDILEHIDPENRELMRQRERYWISQYQSNDKQIGYNISSGGDGAGIGTDNISAKLTEDQYQEICLCLKQNELTITQIAERYNMSLGALSRLNNGHSYYHSNIEYPIRTKQLRAKGLDNVHSKLTQKDLDNIYNCLLYEQSLSMRQIAKKLNINVSVIQSINNGIRYFNEDFCYPLREPKIGKRKLTKEQVDDLINEIRNNPKESFISIGKRLNIPNRTIGLINTGYIYKQKNISYPIRKTR